MKRFHNLSQEERRILVEKGTEAPYQNQYDDFFEAGVYICKQCDTPLFMAEAKFKSGCGWPSFDDELPGKVIRKPDIDGKRTEIVCASCFGHLGHVFINESFTTKNTRHCVNSISTRFCPEKTVQGYIKAIYAAGCFWGVEYWLKKIIGVVETKSGYIGGRVADPTYEEVCSGNTGHLEAVEVVFDPQIVSYEELTKSFFELHDPTQADGQGPDIGSQYTSAIFYLSLEQKDTALRLIEVLMQKGLKIATKVLPASIFYPAESYHQHYYENKNQVPYCHFKVKRF